MTSVDDGVINNHVAFIWSVADLLRGDEDNRRAQIYRAQIYTAYLQDIQKVTLTKRLVDIDDDLLDQARRALGTTTLKDTVNESLRGTVRTARRRQISKENLAAFAEAARDLGDPEAMARAWR